MKIIRHISNIFKNISLMSMFPGAVLNILEGLLALARGLRLLVRPLEAVIDNR